MKQMFESATLKMTAWYLLILMTICLIFSVLIYQVSTHELDDRLNSFQLRIERRLPPEQDASSIGEVRNHQATEAKATLFVALLYTNLVILGLGGVASYFLARWTLRPIEESHEAEARFTSNASHELRTPLAVMKSELEVALRDRSLSKPEMREILESNLEEVNRLTALSHMLLKLSRNQLAPTDFGKADLAPIIRKVIKQYGKEDREFSIDMAKSLALDHANESSLTELFMIVVENACKYSPPGSLVAIASHERNGRVVTTVSNTGEGIAASDLPHIFERFYRGDKSHTSAGGQQGYGLGLSLAKQIVGLHKGTITIASAPKSETIVTISLPKSAKAA